MDQEACSVIDGQWVPKRRCFLLIPVVEPVVHSVWFIQPFEVITRLAQDFALD